MALRTGKGRGPGHLNRKSQAGSGGTPPVGSAGSPIGLLLLLTKAS